MKIEQIQRSEETRTKVFNTMTVLTADDGMKIINQDYLNYKNGTLEGDESQLIICSQVFLANEDSSLNYTEITKEEADVYQQEWEEKKAKEAEEAEKKLKEAYGNYNNNSI